MLRVLQHPSITYEQHASDSWMYKAITLMPLSIAVSVLGALADPIMNSLTALNRVDAYTGGDARCTHVDRRSTCESGAGHNHHNM